MALIASEEWAESLAKELDSDSDMTSALNGLNATVQFSLENAGAMGDLYFWIRTMDERVVDVGTGERGCDYVFTGDYEAWKELLQGDMELLDAVMEKKLVFEGDIQTIMKYVKALNLLMEAAKRVPTEF